MGARELISKLCFLGILTMSVQSSGLDWASCKDSMDKRVFFSGLYFTAGTSSSSGDCALIGALKVDISSAYIKENEDKIKTDIVRGEGEVLRSMAYLLNCDAKTSQILFRTLRSSYGDLIDARRNLKPEQIKKKAEDVCGPAITSVY